MVIYTLLSRFWVPEQESNLHLRLSIRQLSRLSYPSFVPPRASRRTAAGSFVGKILYLTIFRPSAEGSPSLGSDPFIFVAFQYVEYRHLIQAPFADFPYGIVYYRRIFLSSGAPL